MTIVRSSRAAKLRSWVTMRTAGREPSGAAGDSEQFGDLLAGTAIQVSCRFVSDNRGRTSGKGAGNRTVVVRHQTFAGAVILSSARQRPWGFAGLDVRFGM